MRQAAGRGSPVRQAAGSDHQSAGITPQAGSGHHQSQEQQGQHPSHVKTSKYHVRLQSRQQPGGPLHRVDRKQFCHHDCHRRQDTSTQEQCRLSRPITALIKVHLHHRHRRHHLHHLPPL
jgi:hypothetical protein